jgi:hypothetical protein
MVKLKNYGTLVVDLRNEYVVSILHTAINIARDATEKDFSMRPESSTIRPPRSVRPKLVRDLVNLRQEFLRIYI